MMTQAVIFIFLQGLIINGFFQCMGEGMIFSRYKAWLKKQKPWIGKPMGLCVQCAASIGGTLTFWPIILRLYGFEPIELFAWVLDMFALVTVNWFIFKKM